MVEIWPMKSADFDRLLIGVKTIVRTWPSFSFNQVSEVSDLYQKTYYHQNWLVRKLFMKQIHEYTHCVHQQYDLIHVINSMKMEQKP